MIDVSSCSLSENGWSEAARYLNCLLENETCLDFNKMNGIVEAMQDTQKKWSNRDIKIACGWAVPDRNNNTAASRQL
jgi:hypothetical protein